MSLPEQHVDLDEDALDRAVAARRLEPRWRLVSAPTGRFWLALSVALLAHGVALAGLLFTFKQPHGHGGVVLDAIDVTLVDSHVLEQRAPSALTRDREGGSVESAADRSGSGAREAPDQAAAPGAQPALLPVEPPAPRLELAQELAEPGDPLESSTTRNARPMASRSTELTVAVQPAVAAVSGGNTAQTVTQADTTSKAPAAASPGQAQGYASSVIAALARTKPKAGGNQGQVTVAFSLSAGGDLDRVGVSRSSGDARLDALALDAVRRARFLAPPAGMTAAQLTYEIPYRFR